MNALLKEENEMTANRQMLSSKEQIALLTETAQKLQEDLGQEMALKVWDHVIRILEEDLFIN